MTAKARLAALDTQGKEAKVWQVMLVFLFSAVQAWLVARSVTMTAPHDDEWAGWLADLEWERRQRRLAHRGDRGSAKADVPVVEHDGLAGRDARGALGGERDTDAS